MASSRYIAVFSAQPRETLQLARSLSPRVALHESGAVLLTVTPRFEEEAFDRLLQAAVASGRLDYASASSRAAALFAARVSPGARVSEQETPSFLSPLSIRLLALYSQEDLSAHLATLQRWGIHTLGQLAGLPREELAARLGSDARWLQQLARGEDVEPFQPQAEKLRFQACKELEWEVDGLEPLAFALSDILDHLCSSLSQRGLATDCLQLVFRLGDGSTYRRTIPLAVPMRKPKTLLSLVRLKLQADPPQAPIKRVFVEARPAPVQVLQPSLLEPSGPNAEEWSRTLARLTALMDRESLVPGGENKRTSAESRPAERKGLGRLHLHSASPFPGTASSGPAQANSRSGTLGAPSVEDTHRPDPARLESFSLSGPGGKRREGSDGAASPAGNGSRIPLVLRRIRPPRPTRLRTDQIVACAGPWKTSGEWWHCPPEQEAASFLPQPWWRDEWDVQLRQGGIYRVFWDHRRKEWFLDGRYD